MPMLSTSVADLGGHPRRAPPHGPKFSQFHAVFHKIWQNHMLVPPPEGWRPFLRGILDPPLNFVLLVAHRATLQV